MLKRAVTATQVYTIFDIHSLLVDETVRRGARPGGLTWHLEIAPAGGRPQFRNGCSGVAHEFVI